MFLHKIQIHTRETLGKRTVERESSTCNSEDKVSHLIHGEFKTTSFPVVGEKRSAWPQGSIKLPMISLFLVTPAENSLGCIYL